MECPFCLELTDRLRDCLTPECPDCFQNRQLHHFNQCIPSCSFNHRVDDEIQEKFQKLIKEVESQLSECQLSVLASIVETKFFPSTSAKLKMLSLTLDQLLTQKEQLQRCLSTDSKTAHFYLTNFRHLTFPRIKPVRIIRGKRNLLRGTMDKKMVIFSPPSINVLKDGEIKFEASFKHNAEVFGYHGIKVDDGGIWASSGNVVVHSPLYKGNDKTFIIDGISSDEFICDVYQDEKRLVIESLNRIIVTNHEGQCLWSRETDESCYVTEKYVCLSEGEGKILCLDIDTGKETFEYYEDERQRLNNFAFMIADAGIMYDLFIENNKFVVRTFTLEFGFLKEETLSDCIPDGVQKWIGYAFEDEIVFVYLTET